MLIKHNVTRYILLSFFFIFGAYFIGQSNQEPLLERVVRLEHEQWMDWSQAVADEVSPERRERWEKFWVDYDDLPENIKELDREYARKVLEEFEKEED